MRRKACLKSPLLLATMMPAVTMAYPIVTARVGFLYEDSILVYRIHRKNLRDNCALFTVSADKTTVFQYGDIVYGPYTAQEDPTAILDTELCA